MQKFRIIAIGKIKNKNLAIEIDKLKKRISRLEIIELKEIKDKNISIIKKKEFELISPFLKMENHNILLIENGMEFSTRQFYDKIKKIEKEITFIITGAFGPSKELIDKCETALSLSKMTFTHEQAQYLLLEQLYRAECYEKNIPYTK